MAQHAHIMAHPGRICSAAMNFNFNMTWTIRHGGHMDTTTVEGGPNSLRRVRWDQENAAEVTGNELSECCHWARDGTMELRDCGVDGVAKI